MSYGAPNSNEVNFNFLEIGYAAPIADEVNFNFVESEKLLSLGQQWSTVGPGAENRALNQQWSVFSQETEQSSLTQEWSVEARIQELSYFNERYAIDGAGSENHHLNQRWAQFGSDADDLRLDQLWSVVGAETENLVLNQRYAVTPVGVEIFKADQAWGTGGVLWEVFALNERYTIDGAPTENMLVGQEWIVEGTPSEVLPLDQQWEVAGIETELYHFDQQWASLVSQSDFFYFNQQWAFYFDVGQEFIFSHGDEVSGALEFSYSLGTVFVSQQLEFNHDLKSTVEQELIFDHSSGIVEGQLEFRHDLAYHVAAQLEINHDLVGTVEQQLEFNHDISTVDIVENQLVLVYSLIGGSTIVVTGSPELTVGGQTISLQEAEISFDEGQFAWTCQVILTDTSHYTLFNRDDEFIVHLPGEDFYFILDRKGLERRAVVETRAVVSGISPSARHAEPRSVKITKTWDTPTLAKDIVEEVLGVSVDWQILNWSIPAFRLGVENAAPIEIAKKIVEAAGGLIETNPDGSLYVRYAYPKSVTEYSTAPPDQEYLDEEHNFELVEQFQLERRVNKLRILDLADSARRDTVEFVQDALDVTRGYLKVFPSPWRESVSVRHTSNAFVSAIFVGIETEDLEEDIEILNGEGSVSRPIHSVLSLTWLYENLTGVAFEPDTRDLKTQHATKKESLLRISYRTRYLRFDVAAFREAKVQFLVEDVTSA